MEVQLSIQDATRTLHANTEHGLVMDLCHVPMLRSPFSTTEYLLSKHTSADMN
jgi:hypothetical protein